DELMPALQEQFDWQTVTASDPKFQYPGPIYYYLTEGVHEVTLTLREEAFALQSFTFSNQEGAKPYAEVKAAWDAAGARDTSGINLRFEAEKSYLKNDVTLFATYDTAYEHITPSSPVNIFYNTIGKNTWKEIGQEITWEFEVPESGYYNLAFKAKQYDKNNAFSGRRVTIDGNPVARETEVQKFEYGTSWYVKVLSDDSGQPLPVYLEAGRHVLGLTACTDEETAALLRDVSATQKELQHWYREIIRITGFNADAGRITIDANREFDLEKDIPGLFEGLRKNTEELEEE
ncbi:MAG: hypothetical protein J6Y95_05410, partial [Lachnospiraceae bacterium]|nr:hypothetical protein [Lachnospiraceae bacterium]